MKAGVMGFGRAIALAAVVLSLWCSDSPAMHKRSAAFQAAPIPGLAAYWPLNSSGADLSGNGNNGTLASGAVIDTANFASIPGNTGSASFPALGGSNRIDVPDSASLSVTGSITVAAWIRTNLPVSPATLPNANQQEIVGKFDGPSPYYSGYYLRLNQNNYLSWNIVPAAGTPQGVSGSTAQISTGVWTHVAGTYNQASGGALTMYLNGVANTTTGISTLPPGDGVGGLILGKNGSNEFNGNIDEVRIYSRPLTAGQVATLVTGVQAPPTGLSATPGPAQITLTWMAAANASSYNVYRSTGGGAPVLIANVAGLSYTDTAVISPTSYTYTVTAVGALESAPAGPVTSIPLSVAPKTTSGATSSNLFHRCGCSSIGEGAGPLVAILAIAAMLVLFRRSG